MQRRPFAKSTTMLAETLEPSPKDLRHSHRALYEAGNHHETTLYKSVTIISTPAAPMQSSRCI